MGICVSAGYSKRVAAPSVGRRDQRLAKDHEELRLLLKEQGFLNAGPEQPIRGRDGRNAQWMFYSWNCSLTGRGAMLAGRLILDKLKCFQGRQLATFGYTGVPLMASAVLQGNERYTGLVIREQRKEHGAARQIDGPASKSAPVVVIDDSLSSGTSLRQAIAALEEDGFKVEGAVALVNFPHRGGLESMRALGYRVDWIYDAWKDLSSPQPPYVPGHRRLNSERWSDQRLPDDIHPATAARRVAEHYLRTGTMLLPPRSFDRSVDGRGGAFVSFRERFSDNRLVRDGFWHFEPDDADPYRDLVLATIKSLITPRGAITLDNLPDLKIAATFFTPLEKVLPGDLDFMRYGIVVRGTGYEAKMGGALPNSQLYTCEVEQYTHARWRNAKISPVEPHDLFRHDIQKCVEPGEYWLPYGVRHDASIHWTSRPAIGMALTKRAREALIAAEKRVAVAGSPLPDNLIPAPVYAMAVTLYRRGVVGCFITWGDTLDDCLVRATTRAFSDARFAHKNRGDINELQIAVSVLHDREWLGETTAGKAAMKLRLGADTMSVQQGARRGALLASCAPHFNWGKARFARQLLHKAGIERPPYTWCTYQTATWLETAGGPCKIASGFPERGQAAVSAGEWKRDLALLGAYIARSLTESGLPEYLYLPVTGQRVVRGSPARLVHALAALDDAGRLLKAPQWRLAAARGINHCLKRLVQSDGKATLRLPEQQPNPMADAILLYAASRAQLPEAMTPAMDALASRLSSMIQADGRVTDTPDGLGVASEHDFIPGAVLLALAQHAILRKDKSLVGSFMPQLGWYQRRFQLLHPWGMVGWHPQAWALVHQLTDDEAQAAFVFQIADWAIERQQKRTGVFVTELSPDSPSFHAAFLCEGILAAWNLALRVGDTERAARYAHACEEALRFMTRLIIYPEDGYCLHDPDRALGGVRCSLITSYVRIDFVSHTLMAFARGLALRMGQDRNVAGA